MKSRIKIDEDRNLFERSSNDLREIFWAKSSGREKGHAEHFVSAIHDGNYHHKLACDEESSLKNL